MKKGTLKKALSAGMLGLVLFGMGRTVVKADIDLDPFNFSFWGEYEQDVQYSNWQWKDDDSSSYIYYIRGEAPIYMSIIAYDDNLGYIEDIRTQVKRYEPGMNGEIYNWVNENGYSKAVLKGESSPDYNYYGSGVWAADTVDD